MIVFVVGPPGVGKGTQCALLARDLGFKHISAGEVLRANPEAREKALRGELVDSKFLVDLLQPLLAERTLVDGFPRSIANLLEWRDRGLPCDLVLHYTATRATLERRLAARGRGDDDPEVIRRRLDQWEESERTILRQFPVVLTLDTTDSPGIVHARAMPFLK